MLGKPASDQHQRQTCHQQKSIPTSTPDDAMTSLGLGVDGHRWGIRLHGRKYRAKVDELLEAVGAMNTRTCRWACSGGERNACISPERANDPKILLWLMGLLSWTQPPVRGG